MDEVVVLGAVRTPMGRFGGGLASVPAVDLGAIAIGGALASSGVPSTAVDMVVMGHVLTAGLGQLTARQAAVRAGVPMTTPAENVDKVCLSGMAAISRARDLIRVGDAGVVVAGGMESMSRAQHVLDPLRSGVRMGDATLVDSMLHDGLTCAFDGCSMGLATERHGRTGELGGDRAAQDRWAARSHARAVAAWDAGRFATEVVAVPVSQRKGDPTLVARDEGMRDDVTEASLAALRPAFDPDGSITAGNASQLSDGAAALVLASRVRAEELGIAPLATVTGWASVAGPDASLLLQPAAAIRAVARRVGLDPTGFDAIEVNEAFASVAVASTRELGVDEARVNVEGGAIALGHPLGCSGARVVVTLLHTLRQRGGGHGVAALCGGGGQGDALALRVA